MCQLDPARNISKQSNVAIRTHYVSLREGAARVEAWRAAFPQLRPPSPRSAMAALRNAIPADSPRSASRPSGTVEYYAQRHRLGLITAEVPGPPVSGRSPDAGRALGEQLRSAPGPRRILSATKDVWVWAWSLRRARPFEGKFACNNDALRRAFASNGTPHRDAIAIEQSRFFQRPALRRLIEHVDRGPKRVTLGFKGEVEFTRRRCFGVTKKKTQA
jgi:hypothetical protein